MTTMWWAGDVASATWAERQGHRVRWMVLPLSAQAARCDLMQDMCLAFCPVRIHDRAPAGCRLNVRWMDTGGGPACVLQGREREAANEGVHGLVVSNNLSLYGAMITTARCPSERCPGPFAHSSARAAGVRLSPTRASASLVPHVRVRHAMLKGSDSPPTQPALFHHLIIHPVSHTCIHIHIHILTFAHIPLAKSSLKAHPTLLPLQTTTNCK